MKQLESQLRQKRIWKNANRRPSIGCERLHWMLIGMVNSPPRKFVKLRRRARALWLPKSTSCLLGDFWKGKTVKEWVIIGCEASPAMMIEASSCAQLRELISISRPSRIENFFQAFTPHAAHCVDHKNIIQATPHCEFSSHSKLTHNFYFWSSRVRLQKAEFVDLTRGH